MRFITFIVTFIGIIFCGFSQIDDYNLSGLWYPDKLESVAKDIVSQYSQIDTYTSFGIEDSHMIYVFQDNNGKFIDVILFLVNPERTKRDGFVTYVNESITIEDSRGNKFYGLPLNYAEPRTIIKYDINNNDRIYNIIFNDYSTISFQIDRYVGQNFYAFNIKDSIGGYLSRLGKETLEICNH